MKIVRLLVENIKKIKTVEIIFGDNNVIVIGGKNKKGKSSVLDALEYALAGKKSIPLEPIRHGETKARVVVETEEYTITRTFTESGSNLTIKGKNEAKVSSPQSLLDKVFCDLSFDPLAFSEKHPDEQVEMLKGLVGIDLAPLDNARASAYEERTIVNREAKALESQIAALPADTVEPVSVTELMAELETAHSIFNRRNELQRSYSDALQEQNRLTEETKRIDAQIAELQERRQKIVSDAVTARKTAERARELLDTAPAPIDTNEIRQKIAQAESVNARAAQSQKRKELQAQFAEKQSESERLTEKIASIDEEKRLTMAEAKFPIDGLAFGESGVTFNGTQFSECSSAEQLSVSVAMGLAMNPDLRLMVIRDGSLLDDDSMALIAEMAKEADAQIVIERVSSTGDGCTVVIEDGEVAL